MHLGVSGNQFIGHNLYVCIKNVVCKIGDDATVSITLYDGRAGAFIRLVAGRRYGDRCQISVEINANLSQLIRFSITFDNRKPKVY